MRPPWGRRKGGLRVFFLDESGFGLSLPPTYAWARRGEAGRVNTVAHLERRSCGGWGLG
jgi:putative transposase